MGIASCGCQGAQKFINGKRRNRLILITSMIANGFGGGLLRDIVLGVHPVLFTASILPDVLVAVASGLIYFRFHENSWADKLVDIFDALGLGTFIAIGVDKAMNMNMFGLAALLSGLLTALGGGIIAGLLNGKKFPEVFAFSGYRAVTQLCVLLYACTLRSDFGQLNGQALLICLVCLGLRMLTLDIHPVNCRKLPHSCLLQSVTISQTQFIIFRSALFLDATYIRIKHKSDTTSSLIHVYIGIRKPLLHRLLM